MAYEIGPDFWWDFRRVCKDIKPDCFDSHYDLAVTYLKIDELEKARRHAQKALELDRSRSELVRKLLRSIEIREKSD